MDYGAPLWSSLVDGHVIELLKRRSFGEAIQLVAEVVLQVCDVPLLGQIPIASQRFLLYLEIPK